VSGEPIGNQLPRVEILWPPAFADHELAIIWSDARPRGLMVDGTYYLVKPSPGLRHYPGDWCQPLYERPERP
jgi:hypothetical protein